MPATHAQTRLKAVSKNGEGTDDFNIAVSYNPQATTLTPAEYVSRVSNSATYLKLIRATVPNVQLIEHGRTKLSNQDAYYYTTDITHRSLGVTLPTRQLQVFMAKGGYQYTITCRSPPEDFDKMMPTFQAIIAGFILKPAQD